MYAHSQRDRVCVHHRLNLAFCCPVDCPLRFYRRNKKTLFINYPLSAADPMGSGQAPLRLLLITDFINSKLNSWSNPKIPSKFSQPKTGCLPPKTSAVCPTCRLKSN